MEWPAHLPLEGGGGCQNLLRILGIYMAQPIFFMVISSSPSNKRLRSYICDASVGR